MGGGEEGAEHDAIISGTPCMYISRFQIRNYKSFYQSPALQLNRGFNIVTGRNNAGKTALLQALALKFNANPHRSLKTHPSPHTLANQTCIIDVAFVVEPADITEL